MASRGISPWLNAQWLNHVFRGVEYTPPTTIYLRLYKDDPRLYPESEIDTVVDDTAYVPQAITFDAADFYSNIVAGKDYWRCASAAAVTFSTTVYGTGGVPVPINHVGITDESGNLLAMMTTQVGDYWELALTAGDAITFNAGTVEVNFEDGATGMQWGVVEDMLNHTFSGTPYTPPTALYMGLLTGTSTEVDPVVDDTAYVRQEITSFTAPFSAVHPEYGDPNDVQYYAVQEGDIVFPAVVYGSGAAPYDVAGYCVYDQSGNALVSFTTAPGVAWIDPFPITRNVSDTLTITSNTIAIGFIFETF